MPVFLWAILTEHDGLALALLFLAGLTDYLDGKIARKYNLVSRVGQLLDPVADRLYIVSTLLGLAWREIIPWWLVAVLFARELFMGVVVLIAKRHGWVGLPVHFAGKAATFNLLYAFPLLLLGEGDRHAGHDRRAGRLGVRLVGHRAVLARRHPVRRAAAPADRGGGADGAGMTRSGTARAAPPDASMTLLTSMLQRPLDPELRRGRRPARGAGPAALHLAALAPARHRHAC